MVITKKVVNKPQQEEKKKEIRRTAAYARVSTESVEQGESYDSQVSYYKNLIERDMNSVLVGIYGDKGISGLNAEDRPEFMRMIGDCMEGKIDFIYVKSISRFTRNASECMKYLEKLNAKGVVVYFEKENIYSNDKNLSVVLKILSSLAQEESNSLSIAQKWSYKQCAKLGRPTRVVAYGYRKVVEGKNKHKWVVEDDEARRVRLAFKLAYQEKPLFEIVKELNLLEEMEGGTKVWYGDIVRRMLRNEVYKGDIITNKTVVIDYIKKRAVKNNGIEEQVVLTKHHEPIISEYIWNEVNKKLNLKKGVVVNV